LKRAWIVAPDALTAQTIGATIANANNRNGFASHRGEAMQLMQTEAEADETSVDRSRDRPTRDAAELCPS
jgi:hypothetical protein